MKLGVVHKQRPNRLFLPTSLCSKSSFGVHNYTYPLPPLIENVVYDRSLNGFCFFFQFSMIMAYFQGVALAREKLAGSIDGVGNIFSEKF